MDLLPIAEFKANLSLNKSTEVAPFLVIKGYIPRSRLEPPIPQSKHLPPKALKDISAADGFIKKINNLQTHLREELI